MTLSTKRVQQLAEQGRTVDIAVAGDDDLGPLKQLPGVWKNTKELHGFGFNMIALPFVNTQNGYRLMMNQYDEELHFSIVDKGVPNRGLVPEDGTPDQIVVALNYDQKITQIAAADSPDSGLAEEANGKAIHREPGLWLHMTNHTLKTMNHPEGLNIARLGTVPHGDSLLALGSADATPKEGAPRVPNVNGIVIGGGDDLTPPYFAPYKHFTENLFKGSVAIDGFDGFDPRDTTALLRHAMDTALPGPVVRSTTLSVDSTLDHAGIRNIPFVVRQANAAAMNSTFMILEVKDSDTGQERVFMTYVQNVILDFIGRPDGHPGHARWPHVSINVLERVAEAQPAAAKMNMLSK